MPYNAMKNRAFVPEEKFMREALSLAEEAFSAGEVPVGAVVVKDAKSSGVGGIGEKSIRVCLAMRSWKRWNRRQKCSAPGG